jgi:hypothetical protein
MERSRPVSRTPIAEAGGALSDGNSRRARPTGSGAPFRTGPAGGCAACGTVTFQPSDFRPSAASSAGTGVVAGTPLA